MSHYDERIASQLDAQYLKEEREFPDVKIKVKDWFTDKTVICGDSRVDMVTFNVFVCCIIITKSVLYISSE